MADELFDWFTLERMRRGEKILWAAAKYALALEEGDVTEAVIEAIWPMIPDFSDEALVELLNAVEQYVKDAQAFLTEGIFLPEWSEVLDLLREEYEKRKARARDEG